MREFIDEVRRENVHDAARILAAMNEVAQHGTLAARHLRGDIWEVRAAGDRRIFRILFPDIIDLAEERLREWRERGRQPRR